MLRPLLITLAALATLSGCASYHLGSSGKLEYSTIFVAPPRNNSTLPQLEGPTNAALRKAIEEASKLSIASRATSDAILELAILSSDREIAAVLPSDVGLARKLDVIFEVELSLRSTAVPDTYYIRARTFTVAIDIFTDSGQITAERQAVPEIARKIAQRATEIIQDVW